MVVEGVVRSSECKSLCETDCVQVALFIKIENRTSTVEVF